MRKTVRNIIVSFITAVAVVAAFGAVRWYQDNRRPNFTKEYVLYVYPGMTATDIENKLCEDDVVLRPKSLRRAFDKEKVSPKPGRYILSPESPSVYAARMLSRGWQTAQRLTLSGSIRSKEKLATQIGSQMLCPRDSVLRALRDPQYLAKFGTDTIQVFSLFLPDTYQMYWTASLEEIFARFKKEYDAFWTSERVEKARLQGLTPSEASTLASIVAGETRTVSEYPKIAGVYLNRLHKGMKLQADPTICYCFGYSLNRVLRKHLEVDSPYNTYRYAGLPPGPICVPHKDHIDAVLNPDRHGYLYFCASSAFDGTHKFAASYDEHLRNARDFQRALNNRTK